MKNIPILLIFVFSSALASAQTHNIYADVGVPPGVSVTYNYRLAKHFSVGAGVQGYKFPLPLESGSRFTPALYADIRINIMPSKKNQLFNFWDFGMNVYKQNISYYRDNTHVGLIPHNNGFYFGLGLGYFRRMTVRGGGPYLSVKVLSNWFNVRGYSIVSKEEDISLLSADIRLALCLGFKF